jgi:hypothetical protein
VEVDVGQDPFELSSRRITAFEQLDYVDVINATARAVVTCRSLGGKEAKHELNSGRMPHSAFIIDVPEAEPYVARTL